MSIASEITRINTNIANSYTAVDNKGGTLPQTQNSANLTTAINSIEVIETATAEGESLSLTNTKAMPYKDYKVKGKSVQDGMPSPSSPIDINSVADDVNLFDIKNTILNFGDVSFTTDNNHLILTATGTSGSQACKNIINNLDTLKSYTLSLKARKNVKGTNGNPFIKVNIYGSDMTFLGTLENANPTQGQTYSFSKTVSGYSSYILYIYNNSGNPVTSGEQTEFWDIKLQEGSIATPYSPYNQGTVTIKQRGKNLWNNNNVTSTTIMTPNSKGGFKIQRVGNERISAEYPIFIPANTNVTISSILKSYTTSNGAIYCQWIAEDNTTIWIPNIYNYSITTSFNKDIKGIRFYLQDTVSDGDYVEIEKLQIEIGSTATDYEPYQTPHDYTFQTEPLRSLPNGVKDTMELQDMQNHTRIGRQTGTLTETTTITLSDAKSNGTYMCNIKEAGTLNGQTIELGVGDYEIIYELATEVIEPLTQNQATTMLDIIKTGSYEGTTNIYTDEDVKPTIGVGYYKKG